MGRIPSLEDYIQETKILQSQAQVVFWPESAVRFESSAERAEAFVKVQENLHNQKYVGISFEEFVEGERKGDPGRRLNRFALLGKTGPPVLEYDKRNLVPSMSFALMAFNAAPS